MRMSSRGTGKSLLVMKRIRTAIGRLPKHLQPEPTLLTVKEAAAACRRPAADISLLIAARSIATIVRRGHVLVPRSQLRPHIR